MILRARYEAGVGNELEKKMREDEERLGISVLGMLFCPKWAVVGKGIPSGND